MGVSEWRAATGRSFSDAVPQVVVDLFSILAEIAFERAKAKSFAILSERATELVCNQLTGEKIRAAVSKAKPAPDMVRLAWLPESNKPLLPQTCEVIQGLRIQELATSGKSLYTAFVRDLVTLSIQIFDHLGPPPAPPAAPQPDLLAQLIKPLLHSLFTAVQGHVLNPGVLTERDAQLMFLTFAKEYVKNTTALTSNNPALAGALCPMRLALAVVAECQARGGCDAQAISEYLLKPGKYLSDAGCQGQWDQFRPQASQIISRGLEIVRPSKAIAPQLQLRNVASLVFDLAEQFLKEQPALQFPFNQESLHALRSIVNGALEQEVQLVLVGCGQLVSQGLATAVSPGASQSVLTGDALKSLRKFSALAGAIASYAQSYAASGEALDEKQAKAQREARKKAIESMMDLTTNRSARAGDFIASLGILPAVTLVGGQAGNGVGGEALNHLQFTQLTLPTGIALQKLPRPGCVGGHFQFSFLDLAQFVSFDGKSRLSMTALTWADFFMVGLQAGFLLGKTPNGLFFLGADVRYAPTLSFQRDTKDRQGVFRAGLAVGYYVPFFDFN